VAQQDPNQTDIEQSAAEAESVAEAVEETAGAAQMEAAEEGASQERDSTDEEPSLEEVIAELQGEVAAARDQALRAQADAQNAKRRAEQDVEKARKFALEQFTKELLPVVDNLERALEAASGEDEVLKPIAEGVELTLKSFLDAMGRFKIECIDPQGEPFDPTLNQAMCMVENDEVEPNSVIAVMQKGYTLNGRLVRPAMVMVSKASG
jgi:molecular chaperone GrpE